MNTTHQPTQHASQYKRLVFIDPDVARSDLLIRHLVPQAKVVVLDPTIDALEQIDRALRQESGLRAVDVIAHARPGVVEFAAGDVDRAAIERWQNRFQAWRSALSDSAEWLFYGCRLAAGYVGRQFVETFGRSVDVAVAAASHVVGTANEGGSWELDVATGARALPLAVDAIGQSRYPSTFNLDNSVYASSSDDTRLYRIDLNTGEATVVGSLPDQTFSLARQFVSLSDPGLLYGLSVTSGASPNVKLFAYDPDTKTNGPEFELNLGEATAPVPATFNFLKFAQASNGTLYATPPTNELYTIDPKSGQARLLGQIDFPNDDGSDPPGNNNRGSGDIAFDPNNANRLYVTRVRGANGYKLYTVDISSVTGDGELEASYIGEVTVGPNDPQPTGSGGGSLAVGSDGFLYATGQTADSTDDNFKAALYRIDPATAATTKVGLLATRTADGDLIDLINPSDFASFPTPSISLDINVDKSDGDVATADPGDEITYTVSVAYAGAIDPLNTSGPPVKSFQAKGVSIKDVIPADLVGARWTRSIAIDGTVDSSRAATGTGDIDDTLDLDGGSVVTYIIKGTISDSLSGSDVISNSVTVAAGGFKIRLPDGTIVDSVSDSDNLTINNIPPDPIDAVNTVSPGEAVKLTGLFATDPEGDAIRGYTLDAPTEGVLFFGDPASGTAIPITDGKTPELTPAQLANVFYKANPGFDGESITYTATDVKGSTSEPATVTLNVPPTAANGTDEVTAGTRNALPDNILSGADADGTVSQFRLASLPTGGTLFATIDGNPVPVTTATRLTPEQAKTLVFEANSDFMGSVSFDFVSIDNNGAESDPATVTLTSDGNAPPTTAEDPITTAPAGTSTTLTGLGGSDDATADASLRYSIDTLPDASLGELTYRPGGSGTPIPVPAGTTLSAAELATVAFTPTADTTVWKEGATASFTYTAIDSTGLKDPTPATAYIKATDPTNVPPETFEIPETFGSTANVPAGAATKLAGLSGNDPDGTLRGFKFTELPPASAGILFLGDPNDGGRPILAGEEIPASEIGNVFFNATPGYTGAEFKYAAVDNDGREDESPASVTLGVGNAPPDTADVGATASPNAIVAIGERLAGTDTDGIASFTIDTLPPTSQGVLYLGGPPSAGGVPVTAGTVLTPDQAKLLYFVASGSFSGADFTYSATDTLGNTDPTPATVTLGGNNEPPETLDASAGVTAGQQVAISGLGGSDTDGTVAFFEIDSIPAASEGILYLGDPANDRKIEVGDRLTPDEIASLVFVASDTFTGTTFTYSAIDNLGLKDPTPATVTLGTPAPPVSFDGLINAALGGSGNANPGVPIVARPCDTPDEPGIPTVDRLDELAEPGAIALPEIAIENVPDVISSQLGSDGDESLFGGDGNDSLRGELGDDRILGLGGRDVVIGGISSDTPVGATRDRDFLAGNDGDDIILASEGEDTAFGGKGGDLIFAGKDDDRVWGDLGDDTISGDDGNDRLAGGEFDPNPDADSGADLIVGGRGNDSLNGNNNADTVSGGADDDVVEGGQGNDIVLGNDGRDILRGNRDDDTLYGGDTTSDPATDLDILHGDTGNDLLYGGVGADTLYSGKGDDLAFGGAEDDVIYGDLGGDTVSGNDGDDTIAGSNGIPGSVDSLAGDVLFGNAGDDFLAGNDGDDTIQGGTGNDVVLAGKNADRVFGDEGADTIAGERGNDTIVGDRGSDTLSSGGDPANANDLLFGNNENDLIKGGIGDDVIFAGRDDDLVYGESGNDFIYGDRGQDTLLGNEGRDTIVGDTADVSIVDPEGDDFIFGGAGDDLAFGGNGDDTLAGGDGNDTARGGKGDDRLYGDGGDDLLYGDLGNDTICSHEGDDTLVGHNGLNNAEDGNDYLIADAGNDLLLANIGDDTLNAGDGDDCLYGGRGNDVLSGGEGNDLLSGDRDDDTLRGGAGADRFVLATGKGTDTIADFSIVEDRIALDRLNFSELTIVDTDAGAQVQLGEEVLAIVTGIAASALTFERFTTDISCGNGGGGAVAGDGLCPPEPTFDVASVAIASTFASMQTGGDGVDILVGGAGADSIVGSLGNDEIRSGDGDDVILGGIGATDNPDSINDRDFLAGNEGRDVIFGNEGNDTILAGKDDDVVLAGKDDDLVYGDLGSDTLLGELGNDTIIGSTIDQNVPDPGSDLIFGNAGDDLLSGNQGADSLVGGAGDDTIFGGQENDILWGGEGNDLLTGDRGTDTLCGGAGDDTLAGGSDDRLIGDAGNDVFSLDRASVGVTIADFQIGDRIGLRGNLSFEELTIADTENGATIAIGEIAIAVVSGVSAATLSTDRFVVGL